MTSSIESSTNGFSSALKRGSVRSLPMSNGFSVLFVDDEADVRRANVQTLELAGFHVQAKASAEAALPLVDDATFAIVSDLKMPGMDGLGFLRRVREFDPDLPVILITAHGDVPTAVQAMRAGAYDFVQKPYGADRLVECVGRACEKRRLVLENRRLRSELHGSPIDRRLLGTSREIAAVRRAIVELGSTNANVIINGETGVGKEVVARCLHDLSRRSRAPFVAINCGAIPDTMFESELFGYEAGAFTGAGARRIGRLESASGGTVFLDELESLPLAAQVKMLRVIQERSVERLGANRSIPLDIRIIAATQVDLLDATGSGQFRSDLYYRLAVTEISVPPLRSRGEDIPLLFEFFVSEASAMHERKAPVIQMDHINAIVGYEWPGNVRELKNAAERFVLSAGRLSLTRHHTTMTDALPQVAAASQSLPHVLDEFERGLIVSALTKSGGDIRTAMSILQIPRRTLNEKMQRHGIERHDFLIPTAVR
jgi:two-component system C4-dicarboxylate transport response regulator DctD